MRKEQTKTKYKISFGTEYTAVVMTVQTSLFFLHREPLCEGSVLLYGYGIPPHFHN